MNRILCTILVILLLCCAENSAHASIGSVSTVTGNPGEISRGKQRLPGSAGASIQSDDIVTTKSGVTNITFVDDTKVRVNENSRLLIDSFVYDPKKSDAGKLALKVGLGAVRYASGQTAKTNPQQVAINTPTATVSVRGTDFSMVVDEVGRSLIVLLPSCRGDQRPKQYELEENRCAVGKIGVATLAGEVVLDRAFQATYVSSSTSRPSKPIVLNTVENNVTGEMMVSMPVELARALNILGNNRSTVRTSADNSRSSSVEIVAADLGAQTSAGSSGSSTLSTAQSTSSTTPSATSQILVAASRSEVSSQSSGVASNNTLFATSDDSDIESSRSIDINANVTNSEELSSLFTSQYADGLRRLAQLQRNATGTVSSLEQMMSLIVNGYTQSSTAQTVIVTPSTLLQMLSTLDALNTLNTLNTTSNTTLTSASTSASSTLVNTLNNSSVLGNTVVGANTVSTLSGATYTQVSSSVTVISVESALQLLASCDTITLVCIAMDGQQQYTNTDGLLNNGSNPTTISTTLTASRLAESFDHYSQVRISPGLSNNIVTLIQNDVTVSLQIGSSPDANVITINQRGRR